jgi:hypothetical protein
MRLPAFRFLRFSFVIASESEAIQFCRAALDCFVALRAPRNDAQCVQTNPRCESKNRAAGTMALVFASEAKQSRVGRSERAAPGLLC